MSFLYRAFLTLIIVYPNKHQTGTVSLTQSKYNQRGDIVYCWLSVELSVEWFYNIYPRAIEIRKKHLLLIPVRLLSMNQ